MNKNNMYIMIFIYNAIIEGWTVSLNSKKEFVFKKNKNKMTNVKDHDLKLFIKRYLNPKTIYKK